MTNPLAQVAQYIRQADGLLITAGAGMGVDSGLPDFRGNDGFWQAYPALGRGSVTFMQIANGQAFEENPLRAWGFYGHRLQLYRETIPHTGFRLLQTLAKHMKHGSFVYTSNVDGQFQKSGFADSQVMECHGSIHHLQCIHDCANDIWDASNFTPLVDMENCTLTSTLPTCPHCGSFARPNILMFNDSKWCESRALEQEQRYELWLQTVERPVVIELGAGVAIPTVRRAGEAVKCPLIRINPTASKVKFSNHVSLDMGALAGLQAIVRELGITVL